MKQKREKELAAQQAAKGAAAKNGVTPGGGKVSKGNGGKLATVDLGLCPKCRKLKQGMNMFQCDKCKQWFHPECCGITEEEANVMAQMGSWEKWFCPDCEKHVPPLLPTHLIITAGCPEQAPP